MGLGAHTAYGRGGEVGAHTTYDGGGVRGAHNTWRGWGKGRTQHMAGEEGG